MDGGVLKGLNDKLYEKRKASALEVEKYQGNQYGKPVFCTDAQPAGSSGMLWFTAIMSKSRQSSISSSSSRATRPLTTQILETEASWVSLVLRTAGFGFLVVFPDVY
jgi:hypothetical protein